MLPAAMLPVTMLIVARKRFRGLAAALAHWLRAMRDVLNLVRLRDRVLVILGLFLSSIFELFGLAMIIPLLASVVGAKQSRLGLTEAIKPWIEAIGLPFDPIIFVVAIILGLTMKSIITICVMRYVSRLVTRISSEFRLAVVRSLLRAQWSFFVRMPLGRLTHATGYEAAAVSECFLGVANMIAGVMQAAMFILIATLISPPLALIAILIGTFMIVTYGKLIHRSRLMARRYRENMNHLAAGFTDAMVGIKPLRAMGRTDRFDSLFEEESRRLAKSERKKSDMSEFAGELQEPVIGALLAFGFYFAVRHLSLEMVELFILPLLLVKTVGALVPLQKISRRFLQDFDQYSALRDLLNDTRSMAEPAFGDREPKFARSIRFESVSFRYGPTAVLSNLTLEIEAGKVTTIAGPSGVGKSTAVDLLVGLHQPQSGRILIDGTDLCHLDLNRWRRMIGYVPQEITLFHDTVFKNVSLWEPGVSETDVIDALKAAGAWSFVASLSNGLNHVVGERGNRLSGGQRQRVSLARALLFNPRLLILDEATTGLDPATEIEICEQIRMLCAEKKLTVLSVSHQPRWREIADRVYCFEPGGKALPAPTWEQPARAPDGGQGHVMGQQRPI